MENDEVLEALAAMFALGQGTTILTGEATSGLDEGKYQLIRDQASGMYQFRQVRDFIEEGSLQGAKFSYPFGRRSYTGNDLVVLLTLLCGSTVTAAPPTPVQPVRRFQDEHEPYLNPQDDPWSLGKTAEEFAGFLADADDNPDGIDTQFPFRWVAEIQFASKGTTEFTAVQRILSSLKVFLEVMDQFSEDADFAEDGAATIEATVRSLIPWANHDDYMDAWDITP